MAARTRVARYLSKGDISGSFLRFFACTCGGSLRGGYSFWELGNWSLGEEGCWVPWLCSLL